MLNRERVRGMFLGIAIGDALYMPVETFPAEAIASRYGRLTLYQRPDGHKWFDGRQAGTWTDDTQLTLAVAESLIEAKGIDLDSLARHHVASLQKEGNLGWGPSTKEAVERLRAGTHWSKSGRSDNPKYGHGNGVVMKIAPVAAFIESPVFDHAPLTSDKSEAAALSRILGLAMMTHWTPMGLESAQAHVAAMRYCLTIDPKRFTTYDFVERFDEIRKLMTFDRSWSLLERLWMLRHLPLKEMDAKDFIKIFGGGTSYVYNSLPFSYAFFLQNPMSIEALYNVGNAGGDTDSNAAIVGGLLGALNGGNIFPDHLIAGLWRKDEILATAEVFCKAFGIPE